MDIIITKDNKGKMRSTEFHFWVGKLKLLKASRKRAWIFINNIDTGFDMCFNKEGMAYFEYEGEV